MVKILPVFQVLSKKTELIFLCAFLVVAVIPFWLIRYIPSLDGPQHLYNARLILELLRENEFISAFFRFNPVVTGNLASQYLLAFLMVIFPAWLAEKLLLSAYAAGMIFSFRYFVRSSGSREGLAWMLIVPFVFTNLFLLGYYNFSLAFIPFFIALGYWMRHEQALKPINIFVLGLVMIFLYLAHAMVFIFLGLVVLLYFTFDLLLIIMSKHPGGLNLPGLARRVFSLFLASVPAIVLCAIYLGMLMGMKEDIPETTASEPAKTLAGILKLSVLVGFHRGRESGPDLLLAAVLLAMVIISFLLWLRKAWAEGLILHQINPGQPRWFFISMAVLALALFIPDSLVTGSMTMRLIILFFYMIVTWLSLANYPKVVAVTAVIITLGAFTWHRAVVFDFHRRLNGEIAELEECSESIGPNLVLFPVNCSDNWVHVHFHCYAGVDKPLVNMRNTQPFGPNPLLWDHEEMPEVLLGRVSQEDLGAHWESGGKGRPSRPADYILLWKAGRKAQATGVSEMMERVSPDYELILTSSHRNVELFQLIPGHDQ